MSSEVATDYHSWAAPEQHFDVHFDTFRSLHNSFLATFFVLGRYVVHDIDHEIANLSLQLFGLLFHGRCLLMKVF